MMSRNSLRRQVFHRNLDMLLQNNALDPVVEEGYHQSSTEPVTDLDESIEDNVEPCDVVVQYDSVQNTLINSDSPRDTLISKSHIYKPKHKLEGNTVESKPQGSKQIHPSKVLIRQETVYSDPWGISNGRPGTPYAEIEDSPVGKNKKPPPLKFQFPVSNRDLNNNHHTVDRNYGNDLSNTKVSRSHGNSVKDVDLPFSPIVRLCSTRTRLLQGRESRSSLVAGGGCNAGTEDEDVRVLPMSPALFVSQSTSTPGPGGVSMNSPSCQSILESNNNSIFNFSECNMCRICHEDGSKEKLVSPCHCTGTMGMLHLSCLGKWLGSSNTTKCEICHFQFTVKKTPRPLKWYMKEPSLHTEQSAMMKDISITAVLALLVLIVLILCLAFAKKCIENGQKGGATGLIMVATLVPMIFFVWVLIAGRRIRHRIKNWRTEHQVIHIQQKLDCEIDPGNPIFRRFPRNLLTKKKHPTSIRKCTMKTNLETSTYISYSLESYKAAMINPVTPDFPLLHDMTNNNDITSLDEHSHSVISLDEIGEDSVSYYQPPECGTTSVLSCEKGKLLHETGV